MHVVLESHHITSLTFVWNVDENDTTVDKLFSLVLTTSSMRWNSALTLCCSMNESTCLYDWDLSYMSCKRCHPTPRTRTVSRRSVHWRQMQFGQLWFQLAKTPFVSQLLLQLLSIKATICRCCMQDNHYLAFKGIPSSQQWIGKI